MIDHSPYTRTGTGPNAVLMIHGIAGSPGHFRDLVPVIPEAFSVYNIFAMSSSDIPQANYTKFYFAHPDYTSSMSLLSATISFLETVTPSS